MMLHQPIDHEAITYGRKPAGLDPDAVLHSHGQLVRRIAWQVHSGMSSAIEVEDLIQIGMIALVEAARNFEERGAAFAPYAATRVRGAMIDHLRREARMSRAGMVNRRALGKKRQELEGRLGRAASDAEMTIAFDISAEAYHAMVASSQAVQQDSIDEVYSDHDIWFADIAEAADTQLEREQFQRAVAASISSLPRREAMVLQLYFVEEMNLDEIGAIMEVGAARICQIKRSALEKLRERLADWDAD
jgi:RNA polymerase sigma factor FliA